MTGEQHPLDRFVASTSARWIAFAWGFAEATLFFIVPDVLLTAIGGRSLRAGVQASAVAVLGAMLGGLVMLGAGRAQPDGARTVLVRVPAIHADQVEYVRAQTEELGIAAVLVGPLQGVPYKIYAVEWGARRGNGLAFLLITIPARGIRFLLATGLTSLAMRWLARWTKRRPRNEALVLGVFWIGFYALYFLRFGW